MDLTFLNIGDLLTFGGLAAAVAAVFEIIKRLWHPTPGTLDRFGPLVAIGLGILIGGGAAAFQHVDIVPNIILGIAVGLSSSGLYDVSKTVFPTQPAPAPPTP